MQKMSPTAGEWKMPLGCFSVLPPQWTCKAAALQAVDFFCTLVRAHSETHQLAAGAHTFSEMGHALTETVRHTHTHTHTHAHLK